VYSGHPPAIPWTPAVCVHGRATSWVSGCMPTCGESRKLPRPAADHRMLGNHRWSPCDSRYVYGVSCRVRAKSYPSQSQSTAIHPYGLGPPFHPCGMDSTHDAVTRRISILLRTHRFGGAHSEILTIGRTVSGHLTKEVPAACRRDLILHN